MGYPKSSMLNHRRCNLNKTLCAISVVTLMTSTNLCAAAQAGSAEAAKELVPEYLGRLYATVETPVVTGNNATVKAKLLDLNCTLDLVRHTTANTTGWLVEKVDCKKP